MEPTIDLSPKSQLEHIRFKYNETWNTVHEFLRLKPTIAYKHNIGTSPVVHVKGAGLALNAKKGERGRGIAVRPCNFNGVSFDFATLKLAVNREQHNDLYVLAKGMLDMVCNDRDPITHSVWWQSRFPELTDGTKVYNGTKGFQDPGSFENMEFEGNFNSPARTFGKFLYSEAEDDAVWYLDIPLSGAAKKEDRPSNDARLVLYDERGKAIGTKHDEDGNEIYSKGGILLCNTKKLRDLVESDFYKKQTWKCDLFLKLFNLKFRQQKVKNDFVIYPAFSLGVAGDIKFQAYTREEDPNQLSMDQVFAMFNSKLYEGVTAPSRKKRKASKTKKVTAKKGKIETAEVVSESDVEGDDDEEEE